MEETPEQTLARLARYRDGFVRRPAGIAPPRAPEVSAPEIIEWSAAPTSSRPAVTRSVRRRVVTAPSPLRIGLGQLSAVLGCVMAVVAFAVLGDRPAFVVVGIAALAGLGFSGRLPAARWWALGVVAGAALARLS